MCIRDRLTVEVVTTVLILLGLRWLPKRIEENARELRTDLRARARRTRDFALSAGVGLGMAVLSYAMLTRAAPQSISPFFLSRALPEGGGTNVVNVMLVDFRGFDTMGEITVLVVAALGVAAIVRTRRPGIGDGDDDGGGGDDGDGGGSTDADVGEASSVTSGATSESGGTS